MDGWKEGREGRKKGKQLCMSQFRQTSVSSLKDVFRIMFQQYFDNHARNGNLSEGSFFLPFKGK